MRGRLILAGCLTLACGLPVAAQARVPDALRTGGRVRVTPRRGGAPIIGTVARVDSHAVSIRPDRRTDVVTLSPESWTRLEQGVPRSSNEGFLRGAKIGLATGGAVTALAAMVVWLSDADERCDACFISATAGTVVIGAVGTAGLTVVGALLGAAAPGDRWEEVAVSGRVAGRLTERRLALGLQWQFPREWP